MVFKMSPRISLYHSLCAGRKTRCIGQIRAAWCCLGVGAPALEVAHPLAGHQYPSGCRKFCHPMRPGHIRGSGRRAGPGAELRGSGLRSRDVRRRRAGSGNLRSWLYTQPDISSQIRRLREKTDGAGSAGAIPAGQRATDASLRARLAAALHRNKHLADENARLRRQLARALGDQRSARTRSGNDPEG